MKETSKIYVDIASLLDLRAAMLLQLMKKDELATFLNTDEYNLRQIDEFKQVDQAAYQQLRNDMPVDLIPCSVITYILTSLKSKLNNLEKRNSFYNEKKVPEVLLNIYPFELSESQTKVLQNMLFVKLETNTMVTIVRMTPADFTPYFIKNSGIVTAFLYDFSEWMGIHTAALDKVQLTDTIMYFPALGYELVSEQDLKKITKAGFKDVFGYTEYLYSSKVSLNFLPVVFYSNMVTASFYIDKFNDVLKDVSLLPENDEGKENGNSSPTIQVPW